MIRAVAFTLNGKPVTLTVDDERMLLWVLRYDLGLTGTKYGCGEAQCGACTVLVNDDAVRSCVTPVRDIVGKHVMTIEGLGGEGHLHPLQQAFADHHAFQCGYCTPGMILSAYALLKKEPKPSAADISSHLEGHICRCGAHMRIVAAVQEAASAMTAPARKTKGTEATVVAEPVNGGAR